MKRTISVPLTDSITLIPKAIIFRPKTCVLAVSGLRLTTLVALYYILTLKYIAVRRASYKGQFCYLICWYFRLLKNLLQLLAVEA